VTGKPTIQIRLFLGLAYHVLLNMSLMIEKHVLWQVIGLSPRRRCSCIKILVLLSDLRMIGDDICVAIKALLHRRYSGKLGPSNVRMTEFTIDLLHPRVDAVTEGYGLLGPDVHSRPRIKVINKEDHEQAAGPTGQDDHLVIGPDIPCIRDWVEGGCHPFTPFASTNAA
jgi:hypothetical protein